MRYRRSLAVAHSQLLLHHRYDLILFSGSLPAFGNRVVDRSRSRGSLGAEPGPDFGYVAARHRPDQSGRAGNRSDRILRKRR